MKRKHRIHADMEVIWECSTCSRKLREKFLQSNKTGKIAQGPVKHENWNPVTLSNSVHDDIELVAHLWNIIKEEGILTHAYWKCFRYRLWFFLVDIFNIRVDFILIKHSREHVDQEEVRHRPRETVDIHRGLRLHSTDLNSKGSSTTHSIMKK